MFAFLTLCTMLVAGAVCVAVIAAVGFALKVAFHVILLPLKILVLPFLIVGIVIKLVLIVAAIAVGAALLIPLAIVALIVIAPLLLLKAAMPV
jgi:hypothetical protein